MVENIGEWVFEYGNFFLRNIKKFYETGINFNKMSIPTKFITVESFMIYLCNKNKIPSLRIIAEEKVLNDFLLVYFYSLMSKIYIETNREKIEPKYSTESVKNTYFLLKDIYISFYGEERKKEVVEYTQENFLYFMSSLIEKLKILSTKFDEILNLNNNNNNFNLDNSIARLDLIPDSLSFIFSPNIIEDKVLCKKFAFHDPSFSVSSFRFDVINLASSLDVSSFAQLPKNVRLKQCTFCDRLTTELPKRYQACPICLGTFRIIEQN